MTKRDDKQVQDALQAIRALVESSEQTLGAEQDIVTLDHVVWRNPVKEETEEGAPSVLSERKAFRHDTAPKDPDTQTPELTTAVERSSVSATLSVSPHELQSLGKRPIVASESIKRPSQAQTPVLKTAPQEAVPAPVAQTPIMPAAPAAPDEDEAPVQELTMPIGRRGGGFYSNAGQPPKPVIKASQEPILPKMAQNAPVSAPQQAPLSTQSTRAAPELSAKEASLQAADPQEASAKKTPPIQGQGHFDETDFNFSPAEGLMTAASFEGLEKWPEKPIAPEINVPIAEPAVANPAQEVQMMFAETQDETDEVPYSQPTLHVVSDQSANDYDEDEKEGFSGAVRLALRSIIKEQVSSWLQGNMTGLIEEALTSPQKTPRRGAKPSANSTSKKR